MTLAARQLAGVGAGAVVTAAFQLALNRNLFVNPSTNQLIDPWIYSGYFLTLPEQVQRFPDTYYGSRLSVLLPGFLAHRLFPPLTANYLLHIGLFVTLVVSTYALVQRGAGAGAALLAAVALAWNPAVLSALSWDYVDGFGMTVFVLTLACLEASVQERPRSALAAASAGALTACLISANIFLTVLIPILALFVLLRTGTARRRAAVRVAAAAAVGFASMLAVLSLASVRLGGSWLFLSPQWREAGTLVAARNPWQLDGYSWVSFATWLVLPATAGLSVLASCLRWRRTPGPAPFAVAIQILFAAMAVEWLVIQFWSTPVLQISYYASYLAPLALLALTVQWSGAINRLTDAAPLAAAAAAVFALVAGTVLADPQRFWSAVEPAWLVRSFAAVPSIGDARALAAGATMLGAASGAIAVVLLHAPGAASVRRFGFVIALACSYIAAPQFWQPAVGASAPARFETTALAHRYIAAHATDHPLRVWYRLTPDTERPFKSIASTYLWGYVLVNEAMPELSQQQAATLVPGSRLVLLLSDAADAEAARSGLRAFGFDYEPVAQREFGDGEAGFSIVIANLVRRSA